MGQWITIVILDTQSGKRVAGADVEFFPNRAPSASLLLPVGEYIAEFRRRDTSVMMTPKPFEVIEVPNSSGTVLCPAEGLCGVTIRSMDWADIRKEG